MMETLVIQSQSRSLKTGELVEVPEHIKDVTNYMK